MAAASTKAVSECSTAGQRGLRQNPQGLMTRRAAVRGLVLCLLLGPFKLES